MGLTHAPLITWGINSETTFKQNWGLALANYKIFYQGTCNGYN